MSMTDPMLIERQTMQNICDAVRAKASQGGVTLTDLSIEPSESGTYTAPAGCAYKTVRVKMSSSGGAYTIPVTAPTGTTVTATKDGETYTGTESSATAGLYEISVPEPGTYTITGVKDGVSYSDTYVLEPIVALPDVTLNNNDWTTISKISQAGTGDTYWDIGDVKMITLNGTVGTQTYNNVSLGVFILDFNHPENGVADNNIIWGGFKTADGGTDIALDDSVHDTNKTDGTKAFNMNHWGNYNYGGWKGCDLRYDILGATETPPSGYGSAKTTSTVGYDATQAAITSPVANTLMAALPSDFRNVLRLRTHWVDNKGNSSNVDANVTSVVDAISLLAEFEIFGARTYANAYEKNHQTQMTYYKNGNSKVKNRQTRTGTAAVWGGCSPASPAESGFCGVSGIVVSATHRTASLSYALAPAFMT